MKAPARCSFRLVGVTFAAGYPNTVAAVADAVTSGPVHALLVRDPDNAHDPNAVAVWCPTAGGHIGHMPRALAARVAAAIDGGARYDAEITELVEHPDHPHNPGIEVRIAMRATAAA